MNLPTLTQEKEKLILDAAQHRFAHYGFSKVTMDEIAEDIGLAKPSLYYYYPTKEEIFRAVIRREQDEFLKQTAVILDKPTSASQKLTSYIQRRILLGKQLLNLSSLNAKWWQALKPKFRDLFVALTTEELQLLTKILREGKKSGELNVPSPEKTALLILHVLHGLRLRFAQHAEAVDASPIDFSEFEKENSLFIETMLHGMIRKNEP